MKEMPTYIPDFEEYIRQGEPDKKERAQDDDEKEEADNVAENVTEKVTNVTENVIEKLTERQRQIVNMVAHYPFTVEI